MHSHLDLTYNMMNHPIARAAKGFRRRGRAPASPISTLCLPTLRKELRDVYGYSDLHGKLTKARLQPMSPKESGTEWRPMTISCRSISGCKRLEGGHP
jgi:hypothetical protein